MAQRAFLSERDKGIGGERVMEQVVYKDVLLHSNYRASKNIKFPHNVLLCGNDV